MARTPPTAFCIPRFVAAVALAAAWTATIAGCGTAADPIDSGAICAPATSNCPSKRRLVRNFDGRNLLDIAIENRGPDAEVTFDVAFQRGPDAAADAPDGGADVGTATGTDSFPLRYQIPAGKRITDRFPSTEIFSRNELFLRIDCTPKPDCDVRAEYVFASERDDCDSNEDCPGQQLCNAPAGICVACLSDDDCRADQTCHEPTGRCLPPGDPGCTLQDRPSPSGWPQFCLLVLVLAAIRFLGRRASLGGHLLGAAAVFAAVVLTPASTSAAPPGSTFSIGTGPRWVVGPLGEDVKRGLGLELHETVRWRYVGFSAWIETNYFVTTQEPPPLSKELQIFGFGIGPRAFYAIDPIELSAGAGYQRVGFAPNSLVRRTGTDANFNSVGGTFSVAYPWSEFVVRLGAQYYPVLGVDASLLSINASFGISTR